MVKALEVKPPSTTRWCCVDKGKEWRQPWCHGSGTTCAPATPFKSNRERTSHRRAVCDDTGMRPYGAGALWGPSGIAQPKYMAQDGVGQPLSSVASCQVTLAQFRHHSHDAAKGYCVIPHPPKMASM